MTMMSEWKETHVVRLGLWWKNIWRSEEERYVIPMASSLREDKVENEVGQVERRMWR